MHHFRISSMILYKANRRKGPSHISSLQVQRNNFLIHNLLDVVYLYAYRVINKIFAEVEKCISDDKVIVDLNMSALPDLYNKFIELVKYLVCITYILLFDKRVVD